MWHIVDVKIFYENAYISSSQVIFHKNQYTEPIVKQDPVSQKLSNFLQNLWKYNFFSDFK